MTIYQTIRGRALAALAVGFVVVVAPTVRGDDKPAGISREKLDQIPEMLKKAVEKQQIAGGSALVAQRGRILQLTSVGYQDIEAKTPLKESTIFRIASMSKPITSVAVMILVDDGKLKVTDPLSKFVPEFKEMQVLVPTKDGKHETVKANREITIHDLLTHSSGITYRIMNKPILSKMYADAGVSDGLVETPGTQGDNAKKIAKLPLVCQPGAAWEYGLNTDVLGHVVEVVSGKTLEEFFRERIFAPLKMNDTSFIIPNEKRTRLSALYGPGADKSLARIGDKPVTQGLIQFSATYPVRDANSKYFSGGGGLVSTIGDYFRFCQMMLNKGELDGARILKAETVAEMTKNQLGDLRIQFPGTDLMGYGFGVLSEKGKEAAKDPAGAGTYSWGGAFGTLFWIDPKNEVIGIFMTQAYPPDFMLGLEFRKMAYAALTDSK